MLTQDELQRERYESRLKAQLDYQTGLTAARLDGLEVGHREGRQEGRQEGRTEGRQEGRTEGEQIGTIHFCERLLDRPETPTAQLAALPLDELTRLANDLQEQVTKHTKRNGP